jgi:hypothetical protein
MMDVLQLKHSVNRMHLDKVRSTVAELHLEGIVTERRTPFTRVHFNTCFAEIEALLQRAGYHKQLDVVGYQGLAYAMFDPARWEAVEVLKWLKEFVEHAQAQPASCLRSQDSCRPSPGRPISVSG